MIIHFMLVSDLPGLKNTFSENLKIIVKRYIETSLYHYYKKIAKED